MNARDIEHMWKVASNNPSHDTNWHDPVVIAFAALIRANEREACAVLAEKTICDTHIPTGINIYGTRAAKAIRARGNT